MSFKIIWAELCIYMNSFTISTFPLIKQIDLGKSYLKLIVGFFITDTQLLIIHCYCYLVQKVTSFDYMSVVVL